jgi:ribosomal protein S18 acetylase RimI-like enzyme
MASIVIEHLGRADIPATADVLTAAFIDNPCYVFMHPRTTQRGDDLRAFFVRNLHWRLSLGLTWVARASGAIVGTCSLEPPGGVSHTGRALLQHWVLPTVRAHGVHTAMRIARADQFFARELREVCENDHYWHVHAVAVAAQAREQGVGAQLMRTLQEAHASHSARNRAPLVLSTQRERNLGFYDQLGFTVTHQVTLASTRARDRFTSWFMCGSGA